MADWSVEEQSIPLTDLVGNVTSINLRVDPSRSHIMIMEVYTAHVGGGLLLSFNRNGTLISSVNLQPPPQNGDEAEAAVAAVDPADDDDDDEPAKRSTHTASRSHGRRR